ncbi:MAG: sugar porter family MFS transporter [Bacteroidetes bacterium]|nr:sugar porter family MFS transporter [Bacteroidota bacterium]
MPKLENKRELHTRFFLLVCFIAAIGGFLFGFDTAVISGALPFVVNQFHLGSGMEGWFVSSALLGCILGVAFTGKLTDMYGRKKMMLVSAILFTLSAIGCMMAMNASLLISSRLIGGIGIGMASMICPLYISELSPPALRGRMVALYQLAITIGIVTAYFTNAYILKFDASSVMSGWLRHILIDDKWRGMIGLGLVPSLFFFFCLFAVPESPRWLLLKGQEEDARLQLEKIISSEQASKEIEEVKSVIVEERKNRATLFSKPYHRALFIGLALPFFSQVSGINAIIYYGPSILDKAGFSMGDAFGGQVIIGVINVLFTLVAIFTVDKWGRKPLLLLGIGGAVLSLLFIGAFFKMGITGGPWILLFLLLFISCFAFSFGPVCWIVIGEIFPNAIRGRAMSLAMLSLWIANFMVGQMTPWMLKSNTWGPSATFWTFAVLCAPAIWLTIKYIPETKGRSLEDISSELEMG